VDFVDYRLGDVLYASGVVEQDFLWATLAAEADLVAKIRPDVIVSASNITAPITAAQHGLPSMAVAAGPDAAGFTSPLYSPSDGYLHAAAEQANCVLDALGLPPVADVSELSFQRATLQVAPTWPEFDPFLESLQERVAFVGPLISASVELRPSPSPPTEQFVAVYLNRGSLSSPEERLVVARLAETFPQHKLLWIGGPADYPMSVASVSMYRWLNSASLLVSGGGYNALLSAIARGVPSLVFPGHSAERHYNAVQVVAQHCGAMGGPEDVATPAMEAMAIGERPKLHPRSGVPLDGAHRVVELLSTAIG